MSRVGRHTRESTIGNVLTDHGFELAPTHRIAGEIFSARGDGLVGIEFTAGEVRTKNGIPTDFGLSWR